MQGWGNELLRGEKPFGKGGIFASGLLGNGLDSLESIVDQATGFVLAEYLFGRICWSCLDALCKSRRLWRKESRTGKTGIGDAAVVKGARVK